jgi:hypothetical protein
VNFTHRQKVFAYKVPRFGEIWWCFPYGSATECNHAVIYNWKENFWFDTPLPHSGRSDGVFAKVFNRPFMTGVDADATSGDYYLWKHETGYDDITGSSVQPIRSNFTTGDISLADAPEPSNKTLRVERLEPDFVQVGSLSAQISGEANPRATTVSTTPKSFPETAADATEQLVDYKDGIRRILRITIESNTSGGNYEMGNTLAHVSPDGERITG